MNDLRYAVRQLTKSPGFTAIALLTLALGIGLNTAMFNIVNSMVLQPLKFPDADRLFFLEAAFPFGQAAGHRPAHFVEIAREGNDFAEIVCSRPWSFTLTEPDRPADVIASLRTSAGYFRVLGLNMECGREFLTSEDKPGRNHVVILSHKFWQSHFAGDRDIIGKTIRLDGQTNEIIGVAPAAADDPRTVGSPKIYRPLALTAEEIADHNDHEYTIIGHYRPSVTEVHAETRLSAIAAILAIADPSEYTGRTLRARSLHPELRGSKRQIIFMLIGLSGFVLLIACANLANLLLARAIVRTREFSIRGALGASRSQLIRPLVTECTLLAVTGGALGLLICLWTNAWMERQFTTNESVIAFVTDWRLLLFAFGMSLVTALFFGIAPAWLISRIQANDSLKTGTRGSIGGRSQNRFRSMLIVAQFALALVLLSGAAFFVRGIDQMLRRDAGWQPAPLLRGVLNLPSTHYDSATQMMQFYEKVQTRISSLPGVASAAISYEIPVFGFKSGNGFIMEGQTPVAPSHEFWAPVNGVTTGYFDTVGTRLVRGRDFTPSDRSDSPHVIIVSETMARTLFPRTEAIGQRLAYRSDKKPVWMEIVGVVKDVEFINFGYVSGPHQAYIPLSQSTWSYVALSVRASVPAATLIEPVRRSIAELDPDMAVWELTPASDFIKRSMQDILAVKHLLVAFALLGLLLAALGIYGVIAHLVAQRTNEIGIRMALGAGLGQIARLIMSMGMRLVLIGTTLGLAGTMGFARFLASTMPGLSGTNNVTTIAGATVALIAIALLACWLPARRATKVDPMVALRAE